MKASGQQCMSVILFPMNTMLSLSGASTLNESYRWLRNGSSANAIVAMSNMHSKVVILFINSC